MTAQIQDKVYYQEQEYVIVGIKGSGLLSPQDFGMRPVMLSTACYRGYYSEYSCLAGYLVLMGLTVRTANGVYLELDGIQPVPDDRFNAGRYTGLEIKTSFSGGLLIAQAFIPEMYVHMGFQKPFAYEVVKELLLEQGRVLAEANYSAKVAEMRSRLKRQTGKVTQDLNDARLRKWMDWMFSMDYDLA